jgi:hypothetical protein
MVPVGRHRVPDAFQRGMHGHRGWSQGSSSASRTRGLSGEDLAHAPSTLALERRSGLEHGRAATSGARRDHQRSLSLGVDTHD